MRRSIWIGLGAAAAAAVCLVIFAVVPFFSRAKEAQEDSVPVTFIAPPLDPSATPQQPPPLDAASGGAEIDTADAEAAQDQTDALAMAEAYASLLPDTSGQAYRSMTDADMTALLQWMDSQGIPATDADNQTPLCQSQAVRDYVAAPAGELTLYQLCYDGGLIQNRIRAQGETLRLRLTRVYWENGEARLGYSEDYALTELFADQASLTYTRLIPGNPESQSNHDGYVDPVTRIPLA